MCVYEPLYGPCIVYELQVTLLLFFIGVRLNVVTEEPGSSYWNENKDNLNWSNLNRTSNRVSVGEVSFLGEGNDTPNRPSLNKT